MTRSNGFIGRSCGSLLNWLKTSGRVYWRRFGSPAFLILAIASAVAIIAYDSRRILAYTFQLDPIFILLSIVIEFTGLLAAVPAWHMILSKLGGHLSYRDDLRLYCYSFLGLVIPGGIWMFVGRATLYEREGVAPLKVTVATVIEMVLMGIAGLLVYGFSLLFFRDDVFWQHPALALILITLALLLIQPPVFNRISHFILNKSNQAVGQTIFLSYREVSTLLGLEILVVLIGGTAVYFLLKSLVVVPSSWYVTVVAAWAAGVAASNLLFWVPGKLILRDGVTILALIRTLQPSLAIIFVLIVRLWTVMSIMIAVALAWLFLRRKSEHLEPKITKSQ